MGGPSSAPLLSIVVATRNDDHGGDMLRRMRTTLRALVEQLERFRIPSELILVEYNPPDEKPLSADLIGWPQGLEQCTIWLLEVGRRLHRRLRHSRKFPMIRSVAINAGVRRSRGDFILPGTLDALYPDALMQFIASGKLREDEIYRVDRYDVGTEVLDIEGLDAQLAWCERNVKGVQRQHPHNTPDLPDLHTNACGDFQMLSREAWFAVCGYGEADVVGAHADSVLEYAAYAAGNTERVLPDPCRMYHVDHASGFHRRIDRRQPLLERAIRRAPISQELEERLLYRLQQKKFYKLKTYVQGVRTLDWIYGGIERCRDMVQGRRPYTLNGANWGLADQALPTRVVSLARWDRSPPGSEGPLRGRIG